MPSEAALRRELVAVCRRMDELRYAPGSSGNVSARLGGGAVLITPTGSELRSLKASELVKVTLDGRIIGKGRPSSELSVHAAVYRRRADVGAIVHAHPPACVGFAIAGKDLGEPCSMELYLVAGRPMLVPFATPGESGRLIEPLLGKADAFLLANHGVITLGETLRQAAHRMEALENFAQALLVARILGGERRFTGRQVAAIKAFMLRAGLRPHGVRRARRHRT